MNQAPPAYEFSNDTVTIDSHPVQGQQHVNYNRNDDPDNEELQELKVKLQKTLPLVACGICINIVNVILSFGSIFNLIVSIMCLFLAIFIFQKIRNFEFGNPESEKVDLNTIVKSCQALIFATFVSWVSSTILIFIGWDPTISIILFILVTIFSLAYGLVFFIPHQRARAIQKFLSSNPI